jgi:beta-lactamase superfamily II metal-dependent hydrolase
MCVRLALVAVSIVLLAGAAAAKDLEIYFIDVEGGQSTLVVTPEGQALLIDAGYGGRGGRDPSRILAAARDAHVTRIDYLLVTHFHPDHAGGVAELAAQIPIGTFIDYGGPLGTPIGNDRMVDRTFPAYETARGDAPHLEPRVGDHLPLKGLEATVVATGGEVLPQPLPGAGEPIASCASYDQQPPDGTENYRSLGVLIRYGDFSFFDPGDLSGDTFARLFCPADKIGPVSAYLIAHHGNWDTSLPAAYASLRARAAIMNNGPNKGGDPAAFQALTAASVDTDLWQLHIARDANAANTRAERIANIDDGGDGYWLKLVAARNGTFTITNGRTGQTTHYEHVARPPAGERTGGSARGRGYETDVHR